ncbi:MAG: LacI family DNA-binding transcriptional regulator [Rhodobacter sp.]|nr:LacI family DNA-binding transcriptional regulator [Rhodobacter sp.]
MTKQKKATIRDVAAAAGVSVTTVSDALSGKGRLPEATREKVHAVAEQLSYRPSAIARGLRSDGLGLVAICIAPAGGGGVLTDVGYWASIVTHASQAILSTGQAPVLLPHNVEMLGKLRLPLDGAIVVDPLENDPVLAYFERKRIHCLTIGRDLQRDSGHWVDDDTREGVRQLLLATVSRGACLGFITVGPMKSYIGDAVDGARDWAAEQGGKLIVQASGSMEALEVEAAVKALLDRGAEALIAQNDRLALRVLEALRSLGKIVPKDVRLLSAADAPELSRVEPAISAAQAHPARLAELAAARLQDIIRGSSDGANAKVPMDVIPRSSAPRIFG